MQQKKKHKPSRTQLVVRRNRLIPQAEEQEAANETAKKAKTIDFSKFVAKAKLWDKGVPMCIFHSLEKAKEYVEKKRKLDAANAEYQKKAAAKAEVEKPKLRRNARGLVVLPTERHRCRQPA